MAERYRLSVTFRMSSAVQRRAWEILSQVPPGQRTERLAEMVCGCQEAQDLRKIVRDAIHGELKNNEIKVRAAKEETKIPQRALDFLQTL